MMGGYKPKYEMVYELDKNKIKSFEYKRGINYLKIENDNILEICGKNLEKFLV